MSTFDFYKRYGITPSKLRYMIDNHFYFPEQYKDCLSHYRMSQTSTARFLTSILEGTIIPLREGITYQIIYHQTDPTRLKRRAAYTSVKLSFRVAQPEFDIIPTVLVKEVRDTGDTEL